jgi:hypothetical protein
MYLKKLSASFFLFLSILFSLPLPALAQGTQAPVDPNTILSGLAGCTPKDTAQVSLCSAVPGMSANRCKAMQCVLEYVNNADGQRPSTWYNQSLSEFSTKVMNPKNPESIFGERYTFAHINWIINSIFTITLPSSGRLDVMVGLMQVLKLISQNPYQPLDPINALALGSMMIAPSAIGQMFNSKPASGVQEVKNIASKLFDPPTASAQGVGYTKLSGAGNIRAIWTASRNTAYLFIIVLLIAAGFMVMFRFQLNPQTVVTVQMMIPKLAVTIFLVTFSYAIAGFVIDNICVVIALIFGFLALPLGPGGLPIVPPMALGPNIDLICNAGTTYIQNVFLAAQIAQSWSMINLIMITQIVSAGSGMLGSAASGLLPAAGPGAGILLGLVAAGSSLATGVGGIVIVVLTIVLGLNIWALWALIKIIVTLFVNYLHLVFLVIFGPIQIMLDMIPGGKGSQGFIPWLKCIIGCSSVFVMTAVAVILAQLIFNLTTCVPSSGSLGTCTTPVFNINGIFTSASPGFTVPFINGGDPMLGDIRFLGTGNLSGGLFTGATGSGIFNMFVSNTAFLFLLVGFFNFLPTIMVSVKSAICGKDEINMDAAIKPLQDVINQLTGFKPSVDLTGVGKGLGGWGQNNSGSGFGSWLKK